MTPLQKNDNLPQNNEAAPADRDDAPTAATGEESVLSAEDQAYAAELARHATNQANDASEAGDASDVGGADDADGVGEADRRGEADNIDNADGLDNVDGVGEAEEAEDHNCTEGFKPAPAVPGEFRVRAGDIGQWEHHFRRFSPLTGSHSSALALSASDPMGLRPIVILEVKGRYVVIDGRFLLEQIKAAHPKDPDVMVRVVLFRGGEEEAVEAMCNEGFGREPATKMEIAHGLLALQRAGRKSQTALADQYAALTKDKVSQMLIAARLQDAYPVLFELVFEPHKLPISFGVALNKVVKAMSRTDFTKLLARAKTLVEEGERCAPEELYELLGLHQPAGKPAKPAAKAPSEVEAAVAEAIFGEDDKPVGAVAPLVDGGEQFFLPPADAVERMTASEREAAANGFIACIIRYFGLGKPG